MKQNLLICILCFLTTTIWGDPSTWSLYKKDVLRIHPQINGWCSAEKAEKLMEMVYEIKPSLTVEIGSLAGATTFPIVCTLNYLNHGLLFAIDAWDNELCLEGLDQDDPNRAYWLGLNIDMDSTYASFLDWLTQFSLKRFCTPMRIRSDQAVKVFSDLSIDLLYIDGNISSEGSLSDVTLYLPKVAHGGYICLNHADLFTKNKSVAFLMKHCKWVKEKSIGIQTIVFRKP